MLPLRRQKEKKNYRKGIQPERETALIHVILLNKAFRVIVLLFLAATVIPIIVYLMVFSREIGPLEYDRNQVGTCGHLKSLHVSCGLKSISENFCLLRGCCFTRRDGCYHTLPSRHQYYNPSYITSNLTKELQPLRDVTPLGVAAISYLQLVIEPLSNDRARLYVWNPTTKQNPVYPEAIGNESTSYIYHIFQPVIYAEFRRRVDDSLLVITSRGPLIVAQNYLEWSFYLGTHILFGLGDLHLQPGFKTIILNNEANDAIPFILAYNATTEMFHGIYINAPYPVEVEITESYLVIVRAIFDTSFHIDVLCGPTIGNLMDQLMEQTEQNLHPLPNWFFGFHICDTNITRNLTDSVIEVLELLSSDFVTEQPFDTHCIREQLLWLGDDIKGLPSEVRSAISKMKWLGKSFIASMTAVLPADLKSAAYHMAKAKGLLMRHPTLEEPYIGRIGKTNVVYVDWVGSNQENLYEWSNQFMPNNLSADGYMVQANWMWDQSDGEKIPHSFPYISMDMINASKNIVPWFIRQSGTDGKASIFSHNFAASAQIDVIRKVLGNESFILSESSLFANVPISRRQVPSTWTELRNLVRRTMGQSISGIYFSSANICGDGETWTEELCIRWYQFASLSPFYRVASAKAPTSFSKFAQSLLRASTERRYSLYLYIHTVVTERRPLLTPLFYEYPDLIALMDNLTHQALVGPSLLFAPVLLPGVQHINIFFPEVYYEIGGGQQLIANTWAELPVVETDAPLFIRAGHIVPIQHTKNVRSITVMQMKPIHLYVALGPLENGISTAIGKVQFDSEYKVTFNAAYTTSSEQTQLKLSSYSKLTCRTTTNLTIESVKIYGSGVSDVGVFTYSIKVGHNLCGGNLNLTEDLSFLNKRNSI
ncbi:probable maltase-glucoamylase 2 isoform X2 [Lutzomyia longipalpis]|nr:probable maltase-glucoamylase 2 isoform X2 [Lutzomyia longipalpis]XP_055696034.1 probable maltase-glucoamylase 2 isoform X2 [Lutzomyia longipalpis]